MAGAFGVIGTTSSAGLLTSCSGGEKVRMATLP